MTRGEPWHWAALALLAWGVFALGASRPWGALPLLSGMAAYGAAAFVGGTRPGVGHGLRVSVAIFGGAVLLQLIPLPAGALSLVTPGGLSAARSHALLAAQPALSRPISLDPGATARGLACVAALGLFFFGTVRTMGHDGARRLAAGLMGLGTILALVGIAETSTAWGGLYAATWRSLRPETTPHGPFANRNHFAGWLLMAESLTLGYLGTLLERTARPGGRSRLRPSRTASLAARTAAVQCVAAIIAVAIVQTGSRAGILCLAAAMTVLGGLLIRRWRDAGIRPLVAAPLVALLLAGVAVSGMRPVARRFADASWATANGRLPIWRQAAAMVEDFPIAGIGFNAYQTVAPFYTTPDLDEAYEAAHNDYLQLAAEGGVLLGLPFVLTVVCFVRAVRARFHEASASRVTDWLRVGAVVGVSLIAVQETVDFSLQVPANAALFVVLAAIAVHRATADPGEPQLV